jgi:hypothetical protein
VHDFAPLFVNAVASCISVLVLYTLVRRLSEERPRLRAPTVPHILELEGGEGRRKGGVTVALLSAVLLAVSEFDAVYARSALSESDGNLLFLLGLLVLAPSAARGRSSARRWLGAGLLFGFAFTANYRLIVYIAAACAFLGLWLAVSAGRVPWEGAALLPGIALAPALWQAAGVLASHHGLVLFANELTAKPTSYFAEVLYQVHQGKQAVLRFEPVGYLEWYLVRQGWAASLLVLGGLIYALRRPWFGSLLAAALTVIPYAVYTFAPFNVPRNLDAALPFTCLLAASGLVGLVEDLAPRRAASTTVVVLGVVLALTGGALSWRLTGVRSGFARAAIWLRSHDHGRALTSTEIMTFYLGGSRPDCGAPAIPVTKRLLGDSITAGYAYAVTERHGNAVTHYIDVHGQIIKRYLAEGNASLGESLIGSENGELPRAVTKRERVTIYGLRDLHLAESKGHVVPCPPDHVV